MRRAVWAVLTLLAACGAVGEAAGPTAPAPDLIAAVNATRAAQGVAPLAEDPALTRAAMAHGADMAAKGFFDHTAPDGSTPLRRMRAAGFNACYAAENIAQGQRNAAAVLQGWSQSEDHRRHMLSPNPRAVGAAQAPGGLWVMTLARAC